MIKDIIQTGSNLLVQTTIQPYVSNMNTMNQYSGIVAGQMRFNLASQAMEVYDGNSWIDITTTASVSLSMSAEEAINWAHKKMIEERELNDKLERHPSLKAAFEQFKIIEALVTEHETNGTSA